MTQQEKATQDFFTYEESLEKQRQSALDDFEDAIKNRDKATIQPLLDDFAKAAMQAIIGTMPHPQHPNWGGKEGAAYHAYEIATLMMNERERRPLMNRESKAKHTSGPWLIDNSTDYVNGHDLDAISVVQKNGEQWHVAAVWTDLPDAKEATANARLIAAAPAMLEMLQEIADKFDKDQHLLNVSPTKIKELIKTIEG